MGAALAAAAMWIAVGMEGCSNLRVSIRCPPSCVGTRGAERRRPVHTHVHLTVFAGGAANAYEVLGEEHSSSFTCPNYAVVIRPASCSLVELPTRRRSPTSTTGTDRIPFAIS